MSDGEKTHHVAHLIRSMLPFLKEFSDEQKEEIEIEANIQGRKFHCLWFHFCSFRCRTHLTQTFLSGESPSNIIIEQTLCSNNERVYW